MLNPQTLMFAAKEKAYKLHVDGVMNPLIEKYSPGTDEWILIGYSLGGVACMRAWQKFFIGRQTRIALIDSICHGDSVKGGKYDALASNVNCHHWACQVPRNDGIACTWCGTENHGEAVTSSFPMIVEWIEKVHHRSSCNMIHSFIEEK